MKFGAAVVTVLVLVHHVIAYRHGGAHTDLEISMSLLQDSFINMVIVAAPLVGVVLIWTRFDKVGLIVIATAMVGAQIFGVYHHYMAISPDHIAHLPSGPPHVHTRFIASAGLIAILETICAVAAAYFAGKRGGSGPRPGDAG